MDYYIRSWDPDSTYPANPQEGDVCYTITLDQSWAPVAGVKNDNLLKEEVYENGEWKEVGGGGGGGEAMILPNQQVTIEEAFATVNGLNFDGLEDGDSVCLCVGFTVETGLYNAAYQQVQVSGKNKEYLFGFNNGTALFMCLNGGNPEPGTYVIAAFKNNSP